MAAFDLETLVAEIGEDDLHFAAIVAVDRPRRVEAGDAMLQREARARAHLHLVTRRNRHREARRDRVARAGAERQRLGRDDVHPRRTVRRIGGEGQAAPLRQPRIGREACGGRVWTYVLISWGAGALTKKKEENK